MWPWIDDPSNKEKIKPESFETGSVKQASQDSVRAIMLIRAFRIRGHLIANLDPLGLMKQKEHPELNLLSKVLSQLTTQLKVFEED